MTDQSSLQQIMQFFYTATPPTSCLPTKPALSAVRTHAPSCARSRNLLRHTSRKRRDAKGLRQSKLKQAIGCDFQDSELLKFSVYAIFSKLQKPFSLRKSFSLKTVRAQFCFKDFACMFSESSRHVAPPLQHG